MIRIGDLATATREGWCELSARVDGLPGRDGESRLWFRVPEQFADAVTPTADPFLATLLPTALTVGERLVVEGDVSRRLLRQMPQVMELFNWRWPQLAPVAIEADASDVRHDGRGVACFFSAGVDSFYSLLKNLDVERDRDGRVTHLLCVLGYDLWHTNLPTFEVVLERVRAVADAVQAEVVPVHTNLRAFTDRHADWRYRQMGAGQAAVGLLLGPLLHRVLIPAGDTHLPSVLLAPSHMLLDSLYSTDSTEFVHDGGEARRLQKIRWRVAESDLALQHLRVCFENHDPANPQHYNCGQCAKCVRTALELHAAGALDRCTTLSRPADLAAAVRGLAGDTSHDATYLEDVLALLEQEHREPELQTALRFALRASRKFGSRVRRFWSAEIRSPLRRGLWRLRKR